MCKPCASKDDRLSRSKRNKELERKKKTEYDIKHPKKIMVASARSRARKNNLPFDITEDDFEIPATCPILGIPLIRGSGKLSSNSPSLDRLNINKGYVKGNVQVISYKANTMKSDATMFELFRFAMWVLKLFSLKAIYKIK